MARLENRGWRPPIQEGDVRRIELGNRVVDAINEQNSRTKPADLQPGKPVRPTMRGH